MGAGRGGPGAAAPPATGRGEAAGANGTGGSPPGGATSAAPSTPAPPRPCLKPRGGLVAALRALSGARRCVWAPRHATGIMRPPPALALAALCLLALPSAAAAAYFGSVPAAPPAHLPSPPPATAGPTFSSLGPGHRWISNSDLSSGSIQPHLAAGVCVPSPVSGFSGSDPHNTFWRPTFLSPSLPLFSPFPV